MTAGLSLPSPIRGGQDVGLFIVTTGTRRCRVIKPQAGREHGVEIGDPLSHTRQDMTRWSRWRR